MCELEDSFALQLEEDPKMIRYLSSLTLALLTFGLTLVVPTGASAIPPSQRDCDTNEVQVTSSSFIIVPGTGVTVNNGSLNPVCKVTFSTEIATSEASPQLAGLAYTINSTSPGSCVFRPGPILTEVDNGFDDT